MLAPFMRYLIGTVLVDTNGSLLAAGLLHASMNASGALAAVHGIWQYPAGKAHRVNAGQAAARTTPTNESRLLGQDRHNGRVTHLYPQTPRTSPARNAQRVSYDQETVHAVLDEAVVCHVGFVVEGRPVVLPHLHARLEEVLYLHGSTGARAMHAARGDGLEVCVTVTLLDGLVLARSAFHHSVNYRSVVVHGTAAVVEDPQEKTTALAALVEAVAPGRTGGTRPPSRDELAATTVLRLDLHEVSVKVRTGPPNDDPEDLGLPYWAGVLPLVTGPGTPQPNDDLPDGVAIPEHVTAWKRPRTP